MSGERDRFFNQSAKVATKTVESKLPFIGLARLLPELRDELRILEQAPQSRRQRLGCFRPNEQGILAVDQDFQDASDGGSDQRFAQAERFQDDDRQSFIPRRRDDHVRVPHQPNGVGVIERAGDGNILQRRGHAIDLQPKIRIENSSAQLKLRFLQQLRREQSQSFDENILPFARLDAGEKNKTQSSSAGRFTRD